MEDIFLFKTERELRALKNQHEFKIHSISKFTSVEIERPLSKLCP